MYSSSILDGASILLRPPRDAKTRDSSALRCVGEGPPDPARMTPAHPGGPSGTHVPHVWDEQVEEPLCAGTRGGRGAGSRWTRLPAIPFAAPRLERKSHPAPSCAGSRRVATRRVLNGEEAPRSAARLLPPHSPRGSAPVANARRPVPHSKSRDRERVVRDAVEPILEALLVHVGGVIEGAFGHAVGGRALRVAWPVVRRGSCTSTLRTHPTVIVSTVVAGA